MPRPHRAVVLPAVGLVLAAALLSGCGSDGSPGEAAKTDASEKNPHQHPDAAVTVQVEDDRFSPADITISAGDTVSWHFDGDLPHGVQGIGDKAMSINSPLFEVGDWSHTFTAPGEYRYLCPIHPDMRGTITVEK
ncbi:cupredoxin domain-containing protein [Nocardia sp. NBC_00416]|uniref:cupredoxin domain-containing protein n=1 Tax=Nocardia sp. NBC_00416 TaxID=2975991 RepID=UPI002E1F3B3B